MQFQVQFQWKKMISLLLIALAPMAVMAQEQAGDDNSRVRLDLKFTTNYLWRGVDLYGRKASHFERGGDGTAPSSFEVVPTVQPDVTFINVLPGVSGTYLRVGAIYPFTDREDEEYDPVPVPALNAGQSELAQKRELAGSDLLYGIVGFRRPTRVGVVGFGMLLYRFPNSTRFSGDNIEEVFFDYNPPGPTWIRPLRFQWFSSVSRGWIRPSSDPWVQDWDYFLLSYGFPIPLGENLRLTWEINFGYFVYNYWGRDEDVLKAEAERQQTILRDVLGLPNYEPEWAVIAAAGARDADDQLIVPLTERGAQGLAHTGLKVNINYSGFYVELEGFFRDPELTDLYYLIDDFSRDGKTFDRSKDSKTVEDLYDNQADLPSFIGRVSLGYQVIL